MLNSFQHLRYAELYLCYKVMLLYIEDPETSSG
jgi:hypothetical protein